MENTASYTDLQKQLSELREMLRECAGACLREGLKSFFDEHPQINSIGWSQYTPYFNDGDVCNFSVHNDDPYINGKCSWDMSEKEFAILGFTESEFAEAESKAAKILCQIEDDDYKSMFGDHVYVTIHRDGTIETEEYSHD